MTSVEPFSFDNTSKNEDERKGVVVVENVKDVPLKEQIIALFRETCSGSSAIGVPFIERASCQAIRITWLVFFLAAVGATGYFLIQTLISYAQYGVLNQLTMNKQYPTIFPAIAICNTNPFNNNRSSVYIDNLLNINNLSDFISITNTDNLQAKMGTDNIAEILDTLLENLRWWTATDGNLTDTSRRRLGFELYSDMLVSCSFNGKKCSSQDFSYYRSYKYGNCFVFNGGTNANNSKVDLLKTSKVGSDYGLQMEVLVGNPKYEVRFVYKSGLYVAIFNQTLSPVQISGNGVFLPTGFESYIAVNRQFTTKLPAPYSKCIDDYSSPANDYAKKLYGYMSDMGVSVYSQDFCSKVCFQDQLIDKCGCSDVEVPNLRGAKYCNSPFYQCMFDFAELFTNADLEVQCKSACPVKCNTVNYNLQLSQSKYPTDYYKTLLATKSDFTDNIDVLFVGESLVKFIINYEDIQYTQITEIPVTAPDALVGQLGGQLGAFLGITFLSIIEVVDLIMNIIRAVYLHRRNREQQEANKVKPLKGF